VQRPVVELTVTAAIEPMAIFAPRGNRDRRDAGLAGEVGVGWEALSAGCAADQRRGGQDTQALLGQQGWAVAHDQRVQLALQEIGLA
jgi:hypothetical protein